MTAQTFDAQAINEDDLKAVQGGGFWKDTVNLGVTFVPYVGAANKLAEFFGAPTAGDVVENNI